MIHNLFVELDRAGVRYCILHGFDRPPDNVTSDIDIAIAPEDFGTLGTILRASKLLRVVQVLQHEATSFYIVLADRGGNRVTYWPLDVEFDYRRKGRIFLTSAELLAGRRKLDGVWVASHRAELSYLIAKKICKASLPDHQRARLIHLVEALGAEARAIMQRLLGDEWGARTIDWIFEENWAAIESQMGNLNRALRLHTLREDPFSPVRYWLLEFKRMWIRLRYPTGLFVAIMGPDGAGKSTLAHAIEERLAKAFRQTEALHLRPNLLMGKLVSSPVTSPHSSTPRSWFGSVSKLLAFYWPDYNFGYLARIWPKLLGSTLILFDRYYDDLLMDPRRYRYSGSMKLARFLRSYVPSPSIYLVLDAPENVLLERKREVSQKELSRLRIGYRDLAGRHPYSILLDASLPADEVAHHAVERVLGFMQDRFEHRSHVWFGADSSEATDYIQSSLSISCNDQANSTGGSVNLDEAPDGVFARFAKLMFRDGRGYLLPLASGRAAARALSLYNAQNGIARFARALLAPFLRLGIGSLLLPTLRLRVHPSSDVRDENATHLLEHIEKNPR